MRAAVIGPFNFIRFLQAVLVDGQTILHFTRKRWDVLARDDERGQIEQVQKHFVAVAVTQVVNFFNFLEIFVKNLPQSRAQVLITRRTSCTELLRSDHSLHQHHVIICQNE